jgi:hypothetical protein
MRYSRHPTANRVGRAQEQRIMLEWASQGMVVECHPADAARDAIEDAFDDRAGKAELGHAGRRGAPQVEERPLGLFAPRPPAIARPNGESGTRWGGHSSSARLAGPIVFGRGRIRRGRRSPTHGLDPDLVRRLYDMLIDEAAGSRRHSWA